MSIYDDLFLEVANAIRNDALLVEHLLDDQLGLDIDYDLPPAAEDLERPCIRLSGTDSLGDRRNTHTFILNLWMPSEFTTAQTDLLLILAERLQQALEGRGTLQLTNGWGRRPERDAGLDCARWFGRAYL